jgi:hypothetical protein
MRSIFDVIASNNTVRYALNPSFYRVFGCGIGDFWDNLAGFDILGFEARLFGDLEGSLQDAVLERFGEEGVLLVFKAIGTVAISYDELKEAQKYLPKHHTDRYRPASV